jgi:ribosomal protein S21
MSKKHPVNISVTPRGRNDTAQRMIKRFMKKVKKEKVLETHREGLRYKKPSEKRRERKKRRKQVLKKLAEENKIKDN